MNLFERLKEKLDGIKEVLSVNPYGRVSDNASFRTLKLAVKQITNDKPYHEIIPKTSDHGGWHMGIELPKKQFDKAFPKDKTVRVSMLAEREMEDSKAENLYRIPWFNHVSIDLTTGYNATVEDVEAHIEKVASMSIEQGSSNKDIYCHCTPGASRSYLYTICSLHKNAEAMFDWLKEVPMPIMFGNPTKSEKDKIIKEIADTRAKQAERNRIKEQYKKELVEARTEQIKKEGRTPNNNAIDAEIDQLFNELKEQPTVDAVAKYVALRNPNVKPLYEMKNGQGNLLGLFSLKDFYDKLPSYNFAKDDELRKAGVASCRFITEIPFNFRTPEDIKKQIDQIKEISDIYERSKSGISSVLLSENFMQAVYKNIKRSFLKKEPARYLRLLTLNAYLPENYRFVPEGPNFLKEEAQKMFKINKMGKYKKLDKIPAGELIAFLEATGESIVSVEASFIKYLANRLTNSGKNFDTLHAGHQLIQLMNYTDRNEIKINKNEMLKFSEKLPNGEKQLFNQKYNELTAEKIIEEKLGILSEESHTFPLEVYTSSSDKKDLRSIIFKQIEQNTKFREIDPLQKSAAYNVLLCVKEQFEKNKQDLKLDLLSDKKYLYEQIVYALVGKSSELPALSSKERTISLLGIINKAFKENMYDYNTLDNAIEKEAKFFPLKEMLGETVKTEETFLALIESFCSKSKEDLLSKASFLQDKAFDGWEKSLLGGVQPFRELLKTIKGSNYKVWQDEMKKLATSEEPATSEILDVCLKFTSTFEGEKSKFFNAMMSLSTLKNNFSILENNKTLGEYTILPMQRIARYNLLMENVVKNILKLEAQKIPPDKKAEYEKEKGLIKQAEKLYQFGILNEENSRKIVKLLKSVGGTANNLNKALRDGATVVDDLEPERADNVVEPVTNYNRSP